MKVLLINLARLGDLVQTSPAAQALKRMHGAEVSLLAGESLAGFAEGIAGVDE
ncbi:MAG TPA: lipopolysaccharide heptosyltransferase, partial [Bacteroidetes bacterium]|nr:lipopolysaccharide heptosyltransferase [Bacteroidota bacterium]